MSKKQSSYAQGKYKSAGCKVKEASFDEQVSTPVIAEYIALLKRGTHNVMQIFRGLRQSFFSGQEPQVS
jgi:hypothetical protein